MTVGSSADYFDFFPKERIADGLKVVIDCWQKLPLDSRQGKEDQITQRLASAIKREKRTRRLAFSIHFQVIPLGPTGAMAARIDFKFLAGFNEDAYLAFECKRLRIPRFRRTDHNTEAYVLEEGMLRFISGKYSSTQMHGAMIAYVMDGMLSDAAASVLRLMQRHKDRLRLRQSGGWESSGFLPDNRDVYQTTHDRSATRDSAHFEMQHIFLSAP